MSEKNDLLPAVVYVKRDDDGDLWVGETPADIEGFGGSDRAAKYYLSATGRIQTAVTRFVKDE